MNFLEAYLQLDTLIEDITGNEKYFEDGIISYSCEGIHNLKKILESGKIWASKVFEFDANSDNSALVYPYVSFSRYWYNQALKNPSKWGYTILFNFNKLAETQNAENAKWAFKYVAPKSVNIQEICYLKDSNEFIIVTNCGCFLIPPELAEPIIAAFIQKYYTREDRVGDTAAKLYKQEADYEAELREYNRKYNDWQKSLQTKIKDLAQNNPSSRAAYYKDKEKRALNIKERDREKWLRNHNIDLDRLKAAAEEEAKRELINQRIYPPTPPTKIPEDEIQKFDKQRETTTNFMPIFREIALPTEAEIWNKEHPDLPEKISTVFNTLNNLLASKYSPTDSYRFQGGGYLYNIGRGDLDRIDPNIYAELIDYLDENTAFEEGEVRYWCDRTPRVKEFLDSMTKEEFDNLWKKFFCSFEPEAVCGIILPEQVAGTFAQLCAIKLKVAYPNATLDEIEKCTGVKPVTNEEITSVEQARAFLKDRGNPLNWLADWCVENWKTNYESYWKGIDGHNALMDLQFFKTVDPNYKKPISKPGPRG